jgi:hypothetical protein
MYIDFFVYISLFSWLHAEKFGLDSMDDEAIKKLNKNNKLAKNITLP